MRLFFVHVYAVDTGKLFLHLLGVSNDDLVFMSEELDSLLVLFLLSVLLVRQGVSLILGDLEVVQDNVGQLVEGLDLLGLQDLLRSQQTL